MPSRPATCGILHCYRQHSGRLDGWCWRYVRAVALPEQPGHLVAYGTETFAARDFVRTGLVLTAIAYALVVVLGVPIGVGLVSSE